MSQFLIGVMLGAYLGVLISPRLRGWVADRQWFSNSGADDLTSRLVEHLEESPEREPAVTHEHNPPSRLRGDRERE